MCIDHRLLMIAFQSTRPRGRTRRNLFMKFTKSLGFNPRVLAGGRDQIRLYARCHKTVSIHASSREDATEKFEIMKPAIRFQSTRPRGRTRHGVWMIYALLGCFNPRVLAGGRDGECRKQYKSKCYICKSAKEIILIINEEQYHFS